MTTDNRNDLGKILKQRRVMKLLTLQELSAVSGVSQSHLGRIERGDRYPSASILQKIANLSVLKSLAREVSTNG